MGGSMPVPAERQLQLLTSYAEYYTQFTSGAGEFPIAQFGKRMAGWDAAPKHAFVYDDIISYLVRRAICGLTPKNYNNVFLQLLKRFNDGDATAVAFRAALVGLDGAA